MSTDVLWKCFQLRPGHLITHSRRDLLNVMDFEYLQLGAFLGIMSVKEFWKKTN